MVPSDLVPLGRAEERGKKAKTLVMICVRVMVMARE